MDGHVKHKPMMPLGKERLSMLSCVDVVRHDLQDLGLS